MQAHSSMHDHRPCSGMKDEYFQDGITNGAQWYSVSGQFCLFLLWRVCFCVMHCCQIRHLCFVHYWKVRYLCVMNCWKVRYFCLMHCCKVGHVSVIYCCKIFQCYSYICHSTLLSIYFLCLLNAMCIYQLFWCSDILIIVLQCESCINTFICIYIYNK